MSQHRTIDGRKVTLSFGYDDSRYVFEVFDKRGRKMVTLPFSLQEARFLIDAMNGSTIERIPDHLAMHAEKRNKIDDLNKQPTTTKGD